MLDGFRLYRHYAAVSIKSQLQYRASVIMQATGMFLVSGIDFIGIWALFERFGGIRGWTLPEVALFYGMISVSWSLCDAIARGFETFGNIVKAGDFDRLLLRPRSTVLQMLGHELTLRRSGRLLQGTAVLVYAIAELPIDWSVPHVLLFAASIIASICVFLGLCVLNAATAFWTTETAELWNAFTYGGVTMGQYPLPIYRRWFRALFLYIFPLGAVNYLPAVAILEHPDPLGTPVVVQWLSPLVGPVFLTLCLQIWRVGVRHYRSTGS